MVSDRFRNWHLDAPLGAVGRPRQRPQQLFCVAREGIFARRAKTNLPMCLRRCESSSLGRFAEQLFTCLHLAAAEVPCKTAPFASFSGRKRKGLRGLSAVQCLFPLSRQSKRAGVTRKFYEIVLVHFDETIALFRQAEETAAQYITIVRQSL